MDRETEMLVERWILAFCETPPLLDADLMRRVLEEFGRVDEHHDR